MGRPKKPDRRDRQLNISFTTAEFEAVSARAAACGEEPVPYGRRRLLEGGPARQAVEAPSRSDRLVEIQLRRLGNLLNQMVRHLHQTGELLPDAASLLRDVRRLLDRHLL